MPLRAFKHPPRPGAGVGHRGAGGVDVDGWCYVAPSHPEGGIDELVEHCEITEKRTIRFVGEGRPVNDALMFYTCQQD